MMSSQSPFFNQTQPPRELYFDRHFGLEATKLWPGEMLATGEDWLLVTVTGSCVVICLHDPVAEVGGMAHFMLPDLDAQNPDMHAPARVQTDACFIPQFHMFGITRDTSTVLNLEFSDMV